MNGYRFIKSSCLALFASFVLVGCDGDGGGSSSSVSGEDTSSKKAYLIDAAVEGVKYVNADSSTGYTNADGSFDYKSGITKFYVGKVQIGQISDLNSDLKVFVQDVVGVDRSNISHPDVLKVATFLQSIDSSPEPGIQTRDAHSNFESISEVNILSSHANIDTLLQGKYQKKSEVDVKAHLKSELAKSGIQADTNSPTMISSNTNSRINVSDNITVKFSESLLLETINTSNIQLKKKSDDTRVAYSLSYDKGSSTIIINPNESLDPYEDYLLTISIGLQDKASNPLEKEITLSISTKASSETIKPTVSLQSLASNIALDSNILIKFSEAMQKNTINNTNIVLKDSGNNILDTNITYNEVSYVATIDPVNDLLASNTYSINIKNLVIDQAGNSIEAVSLSVSTPNKVLSTPPTISSTSIDTNPQVAKNSNIIVTFSKNLKESTLADNIKISKVGNDFNITTNISLSGKIVTIDPVTPLEQGVNYTLTVKNGIQDTLGNALDINTDRVYNFSVEKDADTTRPSLVDNQSSVNDGDSDVAIDAKFKFTFDEDISTSSLQDNNITLEDSSGNMIVKTVTYLDKIVTITPSSNLAYSTSYTLKLTHGITDLAGNAYDAKPLNPGLDDKIINFTTISDPSDSTPPSLVGSSNLGVIAKDANITLTFSEELKSFNRSNYAQYLTIPSGYSFVKYENKEIYIEPTSLNNYDTNYTIALKTTISDLSDNTLSSPINIVFKTQKEVDKIAPKIISTSPSAGGILSGLSSDIIIAFDEPLASDSVTATNIQLIKKSDVSKSNLLTNANVSLSDSNITINPSSPLENGVEYEVIVKSEGVTDLAGVKFKGDPSLLRTDYKFTFTANSSVVGCSVGYTKYNTGCFKIETTQKYTKSTIPPSCKLASKSDVETNKDAFATALSLATDKTIYLYGTTSNVRKIYKGFGWSTDYAYSSDSGYPICKEN